MPATFFMGVSMPDGGSAATVALAEELASAPYAALNSRPISDSAKALTNALSVTVTEYELSSRARKNKRRKTAETLLSAIERFIGDLLLAVSEPKANGWVYRSLAAASFDDSSVSYRTFKSVADALGTLGLIEQKVGYRQVMRFNPDDPWLPYSAYATRFRANAELVSMAREFGITTENIKEHFVRGLPEHPLILKATSKRNSYGAKLKGKRMKITHTDLTRQLEDEVKSLNQFLDGFDIRGGTHGGYVRTFNMGDDPSFDWNKGGRLYSPGESSYQQLAKEQRLRMTINGEPVVEIDIRASYPTILFALCGRSAELPEDPYDVPELPRAVVKKWMVAAFGRGAHIKRWPSELIKDHLEETGEDLKEYRVTVVRDKITKHLPLLETWGDLGVSWADLMYLESKAMIETMLDLMQSGVPSLSVHDSLIVPASSADLAKDTLSNHYRDVCRVKPTITMNCSP